MIVARGYGQGGEEIIPMQGYGVDTGGVGGPETPLPYGRDLTDRVYRDDIETEARRDERIDR